MSDQSHDNTKIYRIIIGVMAFVIIAMSIVLFAVYKHNRYEKVIPSTENPAASTSGKVTCKDVTSYDHNWNNDVLCTRADGSTFYTNYAGGRAADPTFER